MTTLKRISLLCGFFLLTSCGDSTYVNYSGVDPIKTVDPNQTNNQSVVSANDTAFLLPLNEEGLPQPFITLESDVEIPGAGNFQRILQAADLEGVFVGGVIADPDNWALVSFRYSPCIFFAGQEAPCKEHIRFVYQPLNQNPEDNGPGAFLDFSLHVTYEYSASTQAQKSAVMDAFVKLRESAEGLTDNQPLSVHPVLSDEAQRANYMNEVRQNIWRPFVFDRAPKATTFMGLTERVDGGVNQGEWRFLFGAINADGEWVHQPLPDGSGEMVEVLGINDDGRLSSNVSNNPQFNILIPGAVSESAAAGTLIPHVSNEHNVNCASCHVVDNQILRDTESRLDLDGFRFDQFARNIVENIGEEETEGFSNFLVSNSFKAGMFSEENGVPADGPVPLEQEVVTRMFGYMHSQPVISQRMAFDNGMAVNAINRVMGAKPQINSCSDFSERLAVVSCLFEGGFTTSLSQCIESSCQE